jgi:hypothetical protein
MDFRERLAVSPEDDRNKAVNVFQERLLLA